MADVLGAFEQAILLAVVRLRVQVVLEGAEPELLVVRIVADDARRGRQGLDERRSVVATL